MNYLIRTGAFDAFGQSCTEQFEARTLLDSIPIRRRPIKWRNRRKTRSYGSARPGVDPLIGLMAYSSARVGAALQMKVADYFVQGRRRWVRLHEKGGKEHDVPCHHNLDHFLDEYIAAADIAVDATGYLFRTTAPKSGALKARFAAR
jgi:integrase